MELVKINPQDYGLEENKATELIGNLPQIKNEREALEKQYSEVIKLDIEEPETWKKARDLRLLIQKNRTKGINVWHKTAKDFFLKGGQFVDAIKRMEIAVNERMESGLEEIEKYEQKIEEARLEKLQEERVKLLSKYVENAEERNLSDMDEEVWEAFYSSKKKEWEEEQERLKKEEEERKAKEESLKLHNQRKESILNLWQFVPEELKVLDFSLLEDDKWNDFVDELILKEGEYKEEQERVRKENERLQKEAEEKEKKAEAERKAREKKEKEEREAYEAKLKAEREERERVENELKLKAEAERKAKEDEEKRLQAELSKGDSDKVNDLINELNAIKGKYSFNSKQNKAMFAGVCELLDKVVNYINE